MGVRIGKAERNKKSGEQSFHHHHKKCRNQIDDEENGKSVPISVGLETIVEKCGKGRSKERKAISDSHKTQGHYHCHAITITTHIYLIPNYASSFFPFSFYFTFFFLWVGTLRI